MFWCARRNQPRPSKPIAALAADPKGLVTCKRVVVEELKKTTPNSIENFTQGRQTETVTAFVN